MSTSTTIIQMCVCVCAGHNARCYDANHDQDEEDEVTMSTCDHATLGGGVMSSGLFS